MFNFRSPHQNLQTRVVQNFVIFPAMFFVGWGTCAYRITRDALRRSS
jgi:hypothetical protein